MYDQRLKRDWKAPTFSTKHLKPSFVSAHEQNTENDWPFYIHTKRETPGHSVKVLSHRRCAISRCVIAINGKVRTLYILMILSHCARDAALRVQCERSIKIYFEAIKSIQFLILNTGFWEKVGDKMLIRSFLPNVYLCKTDTNCFAITHNGIMALNSKSVFSIKTRFVPGKWYSALHQSLVQMSVSNTPSLFNHKPHQSVSNWIWISLSQIIPLWIKHTWK